MRGLVDDRAGVEVLRGIALLEGGDLVAQALAEGGVDSLVDDDAGAGGALLAVEAEGAGDDPGDGGVEVAVGSTMMESLPPISRIVRLMKCWPGWVLAARLVDFQADGFGSGEGDEARLRVRDDGRAEGGAGAGAEVDDAGGQAGFFEDAEEDGGDGGRVAGGFEDDGVAADDGGGGHAGHDGEREVPRRDDGADAERNVAELVALSGVLDGRGGGVEAEGFAGVELEEVDGLAYVGVGLGPVLADLVGEPGAESRTCAGG